MEAHQERAGLLDHRGNNDWEPGARASHLEQRIKAVRAYRADFASRAGDKASIMLAAVLSAKTLVVSHPVATRLLLCMSRMALFFDLLLDLMVGQALISAGSPRWGWAASLLVLFPYIILAAAVYPLSTAKLAEMYTGSQRIATLVWVLAGIPLCFAADVYLHFRYICGDPHHIQECHAMTLRCMAQLPTAQVQLLLQGYMLLRQMDPWGFAPKLKGSNLALLIFSVGMSSYTALNIWTKLAVYAKHHTSGDRVHFLWRLCSLGNDLIPSDLFTQLESRRRVVITYNLETIKLREMVRLAIVARRARQLEELVFEDTNWMPLPGMPEEELAEDVVRDFCSPPNLHRLELRGVSVPDWAVYQIELVASRHRHLKEAQIVGQPPIPGFFVNNLPEAHELLQVVYKGRIAGVEKAGAASRKVHADALALAASSHSLELLRALLLLPGGLEAVHSSVSAESGLDAAGDGALPIHFAAATNDHRAVQLMLTAQVDVNRTFGAHWMPVHVAARDDCVEALIALLNAHAQPESETDDGSTPLLIAASSNSAACVKVLLSWKADPSRRNHNGNTPVWMAAQHDWAESLKLLLHARGDADIARSDGATPVFVAAQDSCVESLKLLLAERADMDKARNEGVTPLFTVAAQNNVESLKLLLDAAADANLATSVDGATPLFVSAQLGSCESLELLLRNGADMSKANRRGVTPVAVAADVGNADCLELLLAYKAFVHQATNYGRTPLILAAASGSVECVELLLKAGADVHETWNGQTPLGVARQRLHTDAEKVLIRAGADAEPPARTGAEGP